ncbi:hypothetical protein H9L13_12525 [Sphingomonas lutea]|uniref:Uncharacterized protein n=1 Tax=Sphingomonas lutea TaxID=1045317 RepID=A0A7G9SHS0_9SPHN|nr:hypothetical protein [Sphingomonas lutea]QNN67395.1 hypothetical protein H9L13_12525 [Sphingomonas lutea]
MTRHFTALFVLVAGTLATPALPAPPESGKSGAVEFCRSLLPSLPSANLGECVSYVIVNENGFPSHDCDAFLEINPALFYLFYDSYSDCVRANKKD